MKGSGYMKAIFSNGHVDEYKGKRAVTVGWMLVNPEGHIFSGHSMDAKKAEKTAASYARFGAPFPMIDRPRPATAAAHAYYEKCARELGFKSWAAAYADYSKKLAARRAACKIEIVPLDANS
jgi:hypothetical protein